MHETVIAVSPYAQIHGNLIRLHHLNATGTKMSPKNIAGRVANIFTKYEDKKTYFIT